MISGQALLVAVVVGGLIFGGGKAVHGLKKLGHKIEHVIKHPEAPAKFRSGWKQ